jgi:hypothetical protein
MMRVAMTPRNTHHATTSPLADYPPIPAIKQPIIATFGRLWYIDASYGKSTYFPVLWHGADWRRRAYLAGLAGVSG